MSWLKNARGIGLSAMGAALVASYGTLVNRDSHPPALTSLPTQPGYYLKAATIIHTNAAGEPQLRLAAATIEQDPADNKIQLHQVSINYQSGPDRLWLLTATQAQIPPDAQTATLSGEVTIQPSAPQPKEPSKNWLVRTDSLNIDLQNNIASTAATVNIELDQHRLYAKGLTANLKTERLQLKSKVHGQFEFK